MESQMLTDALDTAQKRVESYFYDIRKWVPGGQRRWEGRGSQGLWHDSRLTAERVLGRRGSGSMFARAHTGRSCRVAGGQQMDTGAWQGQSYCEEMCNAHPNLGHVIDVLLSCFFAGVQEPV
jgi:hypothetical protein